MAEPAVPSGPICYLQPTLEVLMDGTVDVVAWGCVINSDDTVMARDDGEYHFQVRAALHYGDGLAEMTAGLDAAVREAFPEFADLTEVKLVPTF